MDGPAEALTRVTKPLRCTSLHQSTVPISPKQGSLLTNDSPLHSDVQDSDDDDSSRLDASSDDEAMQSDQGDNAETKVEQAGSFNLRRNSFIGEKRSRRPSAASRRHKQRGLSLSHTSPTTAARAINDVFTKREIYPDLPASNFSPEVERVSFFAELPDAIARARKVHYRRDAMLPKTKSFARVQKSLREDSAPFEVDVQKEATLAKILKDKAQAQQGDSRIQDAPQNVHKNSLVHAMNKPETVEALLQAHNFPDSMDKEDLLFDMEDINTSGSKISPTSTPEKGNIEPKSPRALAARGGRPTKRKNDDSRFEPYAISMNKRRAISPSPSSPHGSPGVKGSIFRMEDLKL